MGMRQNDTSFLDPEGEVRELRRRLEEAEQTLRAIGDGEIDAIVVSEPEGRRIYNLKGASQVFRVLMDTINEGAVTVSTDGTVLYGNRKMTEFIGTTSDGFVGRDLTEFVIEEQREPLERIIRDGASFSCGGEFEMRNSNGACLPVSLSCAPLLFRNVPAVAVVVTDLSQRRAAERERRAGQERYRQMFREHGAVMLLVDPDTGAIVDANPAAAEFYGYDLERLTSMRMWEISALERDEVALRLREMASEESGVFLFQHRVAAGEIRDVEVHSGPLNVNDRTLLYCIIHDITVRMRAERRIKASLQEKEVLLKEIHHRVKNNLAVINSLLSLQCDHADDETVCRMLQDAQDRVKSMAIAHEKLYRADNLAKLNIREYIDGLLDHLLASHAVPEREIGLTTRVDDVILGLDTAVPLGFILTELVSNALKHAFPGGRNGRIVVSLKKETDDNYQLSVSDDGIGLPEEVDPHRPLSLGLDLVDTFAAQLGGTVDFIRGRGTEVRIGFKDSTSPKAQRRTG